MPSYLITGASRGLGLEFARQLLASDKDAQVVAAVRNPEAATELQALIKANSGRIFAITLDVSDVESVKKGVAEATKIPFLKNGLDVRLTSNPYVRLINNAGILSDGWNPPTQSPLPGLQKDIQTNLFGVIAVTNELLPLLRAGQGKRIFTVSSEVGACGSEMSKSSEGTNFAICKAAVNMYCLKLARELQPESFTVVLLSPGYVRTDMTGGDDSPAPLSKEDSVEQSLKALLATTKENNGDFLNYTGEKLGW